MKKQHLSSSHTLWNFFSSIKLSIILLVLLVLTSIIGTLIPQFPMSSPHFSGQAGTWIYRIFSKIGMFNIYHSLWFQLLMVLLAINILVCSINRFSSTWKVLQSTKNRIPVHRFNSSKHTITLTSTKPSEVLRENIKAYFSKHISLVMTSQDSDAWMIYGEKLKFSRFGVYAVHASIIFMLLGGLFGSIFGFEGYMSIPEGKSSDTLRLKVSNDVKRLDFEIQCNQFHVEFYESGTPKEFRSSLSIIENGKAVLQKDILVNHPLHYKGMSIFQSSYGIDSVKDIVVMFQSQASGMVYSQQCQLNERIDLPEKMGQFALTDYTPNYDISGHSLGETFLGTLYLPHGDSVNVILPYRFSGFDKMRKGDVVIHVDQFQPIYYTGLQLTKDPGVYFVYTGFILLIIGCYVTFFMCYQQYLIRITSDSNQHTIVLSGLINRNPILLQKKLTQMAKDIDLL
ncbi:MAG: cytochrome c biogenesis protein ResB [Desulfobacterales bacterium]|nr:cytochrome c biogenesis protein ResB [Desulfobacterales bacterium]